MLSSRCDLVCGPPLHSELTAAVWLLHETYTGTGLHCNMRGVGGEEFMGLTMSQK